MKNKTLRRWLSCVALLLICTMTLAALSGCTKKDTDVPGGTTGTDGPMTPDGDDVIYPAACDDHHGDFICVNCGRRMTPDGFFTNRKNAAPTYTLLLDDLKLVLPGSGDSMDAEDARHFTMTGGELTLSEKDGSLTGQGFFTGSCRRGTMEGAFAGTAAIRDGMVYAEVTEGDETAKLCFPLEKLVELIPGLPSDAEGIFAGMLTGTSTALGDALSALSDSILAAHPELEDICARIAELAFTATKTEGGFAIALSAEKLTALNEAFCTKKVSELYDEIFGAGKFDALEAYAVGVFDKTLAEVLADAKAQGVDVVGLLEAVSAVLPADEDGSTALTGVLEKLGDPEVLATNISELLRDEDTTDEDLAAYRQKLAATFAGMKETTVWGMVEDLLASGLPGTDAGLPEGTSPYETVKSYLEQYGDQITLKLNMDVYGYLTDAEIEWSFADLQSTGKLRIVKGHQSTTDYEGLVDAIRKSVAQLTPELLVETISAYYNGRTDKVWTVAAGSREGTVEVRCEEHFVNSSRNPRGERGVQVITRDYTVYTIDLNMLQEASTGDGTLAATFVTEVATGKAMTYHWINNDGTVAEELTAEDLARLEFETELPDDAWEDTARLWFDVDGDGKLVLDTLLF